VRLQQGLVGGGGDLRQEQGIIRAGIGLLLVGIEAVHGVAQLVRQGVDGIQVFVVVEQNVRMHAVHAPGIGARGFTLVFVHIHPAVGKGVGKILQILFAQGL